MNNTLLTTGEVLQVFALYHTASIAIFDDKELPLRGVPAKIEAIDFYSSTIIAERVTRDDIGNIKLILKQVRYMTDNDVYNYCKAYYRIPFINATPCEWTITREADVIKAKSRRDIFSYEIDIDTGAIKLLRSGGPSSIGNQAFAFQWLIDNRYSAPLYAHNGKTPFDLKIAIPDRSTLNALLMKIYNNDTAVVDDWHTDKMFRNIDIGDIHIYNSYVSELHKQAVSL